MNPPTISAVRNFTLKARELMLTEVEEQLEGIYGLLPDGHFEPAEKYPALNSLEEAGETRRRLERHFTDQEAAGVSSKKAREKLIKEIAFTRLNRIVALKMMETRGLIRQTVTKGVDSNGFKRWVVQEGNEAEYEKYEAGDMPQNAIGEGPRQEAYRHYILWHCARLSREIKVLFDPDNLASRIFPRPKAINRLIELMNASELDEAWIPGSEETIGWVYQYFNEEDKVRVFNKIYKKKKKMDLRDIPAATQIFTPKWYVRYLVENTLGRLWLRMHPDSTLREKMTYYVPNNNDEQTIPLKEVITITLIDPACGTMHFGMVAFDIFYEMYLEEMKNAGRTGWPNEASVTDEGQIACSIIENNLYGIDLDFRAIQLSALSLYVKAKSKNKDALWQRLNLVYTDIPEFSEKTTTLFVNNLQTFHEITKKLLREILPVLNKAYYLGSLLKIETVISNFVDREKIELRRQFQTELFPEMEKTKQMELGLATDKKVVWSEVKNEILDAFRHFVQTHNGAENSFVANESIKGIGLIDALLKKHDVVVCNPPYSGRRNMTLALRNDLKTLYPKKNGDLYTVFIDRCLDLTTKDYGFCGMVTIHSFMFTSSHEEIRKDIINNTVIESMVHLGTRTEFDVANKTAQGFVLYSLGKSPKRKNKDLAGIYFRLVMEAEEEKQIAFVNALHNYLVNRKSFSDSHIYFLQQKKLKAIPGWPFAYWVSDNIRDIFLKNEMISHEADCIVGIQTSDTNRFLKYWWEVGLLSIEFKVFDYKKITLSKKKWFPYMKGGDYNKWYGNQEYVLNWGNDGYEIKNFFKNGKLASRPQNVSHSFKEGGTFNLMTVSNLSLRYMPEGFMFDCAAPTIFPIKKNSVLTIIGILNSKLGTYISKLICPTVNYTPGDISKIPIPNKIYRSKSTELTESKVELCVAIKKQIVKTNETSWEFNSPPNWQKGILKLLNFEKKLVILETEISNAVYQFYNIAEADIQQIELEFGTLPGRFSKANDLKNSKLQIIEKLYLEKHVPDEVIQESKQVIEEDIPVEAESKETSKKKKRQKRFLTFEEICLASGFHPEAVYNYIVEKKLERPEERHELAVRWVSFATGIALGRFKPGQKDELGSAISGNNHFLPTMDFSQLNRLIDDDGIMVLDAGHTDDLSVRVEEIMTLFLGEATYMEIMQLLGGDMRRFFEQKFFGKWHIPMYKKRPVYWLLQSPKKKYGVWLNHERMNKDTLFRIRSEYVVPKNNLLKSQIAGLRSEMDNVEGREKRRVEKRISEMTDLLDDVREFQKLLKFISEERGYRPYIDDGVLLNMAPLWELIPSWQAEPKKAWLALERGDYDWAYQAMDHWPERVKEKCKTNKSYAIEHGLDDK